jgi:predicted  nucleic acid-binding Zn-ribbon protein
MSSATGGLKELHDLHLRYAEVESQLDSGPRQIRVREKIAAKKQAAIDAQKESLMGLQKAADHKNLQFKTNEQHLAGLRAKLNQAASNKEFDIIKGQIEADNTANASLEDEYLEALETIDAGRRELANLEVELTSALAAVESAKQGVADEKPRLEAQLAELKAEIAAAESCIPRELREDYRRLVAAKGSECLARVDAYACSECFVEVSPQQKVELRSAKATKCKSCGRVLYMEADE